MWPDMQFPIGGPLKPLLYLASLWDIMCQVLSHAYSDWECIDPHFCVLGGNIGDYSILQLCACSRSPGTSFELNRHNCSTGLVTAVFGPSRWKCITGVKNWDKIGEWVIGFWRQTNAFLLSGPQFLCKISSKLNKNCDRMSADSQAEGRKWFYAMP